MIWLWLSQTVARGFAPILVTLLIVGAVFKAIEFINPF